MRTAPQVTKVRSFVPALYKIFDEILVNAADNLIRDPSMDSISVDINVEKSQVSVWNNGRGLPIEMHKDAGLRAFGRELAAQPSWL